MPPCINATISIMKNLQYDFPKMRGGRGRVKVRMEFFQKFIWFSSGILPIGLHLQPASANHHQREEGVEALRVLWEWNSLPIGSFTFQGVLFGSEIFLRSSPPLKFLNFWPWRNSQFLNFICCLLWAIFALGPTCKKLLFCQDTTFYPPKTLRYQSTWQNWI